MFLIAELIASSNLLHDPRALACTHRDLHGLLRKTLATREAAACRLIRFLRRCSFKIYPYYLFYYKTYPREHVHGMIHLLSIKAPKLRDRVRAADVLKAHAHPRRYHLASLVRDMSASDVEYVGW